MGSRSKRVRTAARTRYRALGAPCWLCGRPIDYALPYLHPGSFEVDHVVPLSAGGADTLANLRPAHRACNSTKRARDVSPVIRRSSTLND